MQIYFDYREKYKGFRYKLLRKMQGIFSKLNHFFGYRVWQLYMKDAYQNDYEETKQIWEKKKAHPEFSCPKIFYDGINVAESKIDKAIRNNLKGIYRCQTFLDRFIVEKDVENNKEIVRYAFPEDGSYWHNSEELKELSEQIIRKLKTGGFAFKVELTKSESFY